ncbi:carbohydrate ABC transporter permease [Caviibacter abscessus]|uniref:carbohydrate ABC transporter permease n=1 Tax=Caviibacter abscessus TaxID=1766719 RepID=UPI00083498F3|nr:ABC transporter permease subunit [Caviibacter abscessus]
MISEKLFDSYDIEHERKNLHLKAKASGGQDLDYLKKLDEFLKKEKEFNDKLKNFKIEVNEETGILRKLAIRQELAKKKYDFYKDYVELSYDAKYYFEVSYLEMTRIGEIISKHKAIRETLIKINEASKNIKTHIENQKQKEYQDAIAEKKIQLQKGIEDLKAKKEEGIISGKAYSNAVKMLKRGIKDELEIVKLAIPSVALKSEKRSLEYSLKHDIKSDISILEYDISDIRRRTPVEVEGVNKALPYLTLPIPGLGQFLNGQYFKALMAFIGTLFIYLAAIPYALGFGNYQGKGLYGLYTLAQNGKKLDKSMIFMIEGIIAIILVCIVVAIFYLSFYDVKKVLNDKLKGVRPRVFFETIENLKEEGLPYIVATIAFILILFIVIVPIMTTIFLSFTGMDPNHQSKFGWLGLNNYKLLLKGQGIAGGPFWLIIGWTLIWTFGATSLAVFVGFMLAIIANNERIKGKAIFRTIYLLPWAVPAFITIMFFSIMASSTGSITRILHIITGTDILIKQSPTYTRIFLILMQTWLGSSYVFLLSTGVLQAIPNDLYEAADMDGATNYQRLTKITVPLVLFQTSPLLVGQYTFNFNNFSAIYLFNSGGPFLPSKYGNIAGSTDLLISYIYKLTIENRYQAAGSAITIFISIGLMIVAFIGYKNSKAFKEEKL